MSNPGHGVEPPWYSVFTDLIRRLERYITSTKLAGDKYDLIFDNTIGSLSLKTDTIFGLTALANLYDAVAATLNLDRLRQRSLDAIVEVVSLSDGLREEDYAYLDNTLMVRALAGIVLVGTDTNDGIVVLECGPRYSGTRASPGHPAARPGSRGPYRSACD